MKGFLYIFFSHTDFFPKILIFLVIYTDFVLDQSGRSGITLVGCAVKSKRFDRDLTNFNSIQFSNRLSVLDTKLNVNLDLICCVHLYSL